MGFDKMKKKKDKGEDAEPSCDELYGAKKYQQAEVCYRAEREKTEKTIGANQPDLGLAHTLERIGLCVINKHIGVDAPASASAGAVSGDELEQGLEALREARVMLQRLVLTDGSSTSSSGEQLQRARRRRRRGERVRRSVAR